MSSPPAEDPSRFTLERDVTRLKVVHRQRVQRQGDADPAPPFSQKGYGPALLHGALRGWQRLLETEYESVVIAGWMTAALARLGAPLDIVGAFGRVVEDEIRHVDLCAQMVEKLGGRPTLPRKPPPPFPVDLTSPEAEYETVAGMVSFFCVFEHLSGLVFQQSIQAAQEPLARWALSEIFRDEAFHGAFGFETAKIYVPRWSEAQRLRLGERVLQDIRRFERRLRGDLSDDPAAPVAPLPDATPELLALEALGLLSPPSLLRVFHVGVTAQLIPRLSDLGVPVVITPAPGPAPPLSPRRHPI